MSRPRWAIIVAEVAVVGLLMLVVYLTLLRSDGEDSLFDIQAPGDRQSTPQGTTRADRGRAPDGREAREARRADRGRTDRGGPGIFDRGEGAEGGGARPPGGPPQGAPPAGEQSPTDDQYLDTLARLNVELNETEN